MSRNLAPLPDHVEVAVIGGGINGACVYRELAAAGYRVLLVDRRDFASGTSEASAMMIWGGLLYLKDWEVLTVARLCASRDRLIARYPAQVRRREVRYIPVRQGRSRTFVQAVLYAYWVLGGLRRRRPSYERSFPEAPLLRDAQDGALCYEEAGLEISDARFVLSWILDAPPSHGVARTYCAVQAAAFDRSQRTWRLDLSGTLDHDEHQVTADLVVNAAGGWTDDLNARAGIEAPYRHLLSRGVSIAIPRDPSHQGYLAFDNGIDGSAMSLVPWGPVSLWGSTDSLHPDMASARCIEKRDLAFLLDQLNRHLARPVTASDIVSLRCGVRTIAVSRRGRVQAPAAALSRRHRVHLDRHVPWISVYGGKLSGCTTLAAEVRARVAGCLGPRTVAPGRADRGIVAGAAMDAFPGLSEPIVSPSWSAEHEHCRTLEDYLRRRTNVAQWIARGGLGARGEHVDRIQAIARALHRGDRSAAVRDVSAYCSGVERDWTLLQEATT